MIFTAFLLMAASTAASSPPPQHGGEATAVAHARILSPATVRRFDGRLVIKAGGGKAQTQVHRTRHPDGGATADFY